MQQVFRTWPKKPVAQMGHLSQISLRVLCADLINIYLCVTLSGLNVILSWEAISLRLSDQDPAPKVLVWCRLSQPWFRLRSALQKGVISIPISVL